MPFFDLNEPGPGKELFRKIERDRLAKGEHVYDGVMPPYLYQYQDNTVKFGALEDKKETDDDLDKGGGTAELEYPVYNWAPSQFQRGQYQSEYADLIKAAADRVSNWNYDPASDASYRSYAKQYAKAGANAYEDTLARLASRTGGIASTYAASAAQQQYNKYMSDLAAKVPELEQLAYQRAQNDLNMYTGLDNTAYSRWNDDEERRYKAWAANQSAAQSAYNQQYNAALNKYKDYLSGIEAQQAAEAEAQAAQEKAHQDTYKQILETAKNKNDEAGAFFYLNDMIDAGQITDAEADYIYNVVLGYSYQPNRQKNALYTYKLVNEGQPDEHYIQVPLGKGGGGR